MSNEQTFTRVQHPQSEPGNQHVRYHDFDGTAHLSTTIVHALADVTGREVTEAERCLHDHADPDALDRLFATTDDGPSTAQFSFTCWGHYVTVCGTGEIRILPPQPVPAASGAVTNGAGTYANQPARR